MSKVRTIGILGGGQLAQMMAHAASKLGIKTIVYSDCANPCAKNCAYKTIISQYTHTNMLDLFAQECDVITLETENIPQKTLHYLELNYRSKIAFSQSFIETAQNRFKEKDFAKSLGINVGNYWQVKTRDDISLAIKEHGACVLKTATQGYDGKGQHVIKSLEDVPNIEFGSEYILEQFVPFAFEISTICTTNNSGAEFFPVPLNIHKDGILRESSIPLKHGDFSDDFIQNTVETAQNYTRLIAQNIVYRGTFAVEYFVLASGSVVFNEIAPRPHNSGHFSTDLCNISQFENHIRAIANMPILKPILLHSGKMVNIIGSDMENIDTILENPSIKMHLYGKDGNSSGRKMGHYNIFIH